MKRLFTLMITGMLALTLVGCGSSSTADTTSGDTSESESEPQEIIVFAAASMTETLTEIGDLYMEAHPEVSLVFTFDSSGTLKTQIEEGSSCDIFISAAQKQMNALDAADTTGTNETNADYVLSESRIDLLENKVALCIADNSDCGITSYDELAAALKEGSVLLAMGNEDVPVGQYTQKIFAYYEINEEDISASLTYGSNVKEVTTAVVEGTADCGIIYATDAFSAGLTPVAVAAPEMCGQVIYPAAVLKGSENTDAAQAFLDYLTSPEASAIFEKVGFTPLH